MRLIGSWILALLLATHSLSARGETAEDPLPSWNTTQVKRSLIQFVQDVTDPKSKQFLPTQARIAVFDNDGTLWPENPLPFQVLFAIDELKRLAPEHPEWRDDAVMDAVLTGDMATFSHDLEKSVMKLLAATHAGMTTDEFSDRVRHWISTSKHPRFDRPYTKLGYQPMLELLTYLRANGFRTFIVSGGGADFMRVWAEEVYGIPPEQTIGSIGALRYELNDGVPVLLKEAKLAFLDDKAGKPVAIHRHIGRRPAAAFGNSDGDREMLEWTTQGRTPSLGLIVHHTDAEREYAYDKDPKSSGKLIEALLQAPRQGWLVVDMAKDWNQVFTEDDVANGLHKQPWLVEDIAGSGVVDRAQSTIEFAADGSVSGNTAVNRYQGKAEIDGNQIKFGPLLSTRRAGPPALMDQESKFLKALRKAASYEIEPSGLLYLMDVSGNRVLRLSPMTVKN